MSFSPIKKSCCFYIRRLFKLCLQAWILHSLALSLESRQINIMKLLFSFGEPRFYPGLWIQVQLTRKEKPDPNTTLEKKTSFLHHHTNIINYNSLLFSYDLKVHNYNVGIDQGRTADPGGVDPNPYPTFKKESGVDRKEKTDPRKVHESGFASLLSSIHYKQSYFRSF